MVCCVAGLAAVGCKKQDNAASGGSAAVPKDNAASGGSAAAPNVPAPAPAGSAAPAAASGNKADCAPSAFMDPRGAFCVLVPEGYKSDEAATGGKKDSDGSTMIVFNDEGGYTYSIKVVPKEDFENYKSMMVSKPDNTNGIKILVDEKIGAGGSYQRVENKEGEHYQRAIVKRGEGYVVCEAAPKTDTNPVDACKTLRAL
ncbi:hypothetical protein BH11MYX2_BH11MYX2_24540 [soil metagenome]